MDSEFLSQDEVDALLVGVDDEANAAASAAPATAAETPGAVVTPYKLAAQEHIIHGRLPVLETFHEKFVRPFQTGLRDFIKRDIEVSIGLIRIISFTEFSNLVTAPASLNLVNINPLHGAGLVTIDANLIFLIVDNLFGSDGRFHKPVAGREFTQTEQRIVQRLLAVFFKAYEQSWKSVYPISFAHIRSEQHMQYANVAEPDDLVVASTLRIKLGATSSDMHLCIPYSMIEPIRDLLRNVSAVASIKVDRKWTHMMSQQVQGAEIELSADLGTTSIPLRQIMAMQVGDFIPIDVTNTVHAMADGVPVMDCHFGVSNGQYALRVERVLSASARESAQGDRDE
jgi:flagellar motor switch protein FliM